MASKKELEKKLDYSKGYRDALVDTWESVNKLITKGYSSRELQIVSKTMAMDARTDIEAKITALEADYAQDDIIDADESEPIQVPPPQPKKLQALRPGMSVMFRETRPTRCYQMVEREVASGMAALCVSRSSPTEIRDTYDLGPTRIIWLTNTEKMDVNLPPSALGFAGASDHGRTNDEYMQPSNLPSLFAEMMNFMDGNRGGIILLEGLEYLASHNNFQSVLGFFQRVNEDVKRTGCRLVVSVNNGAFEPKQISQLETEMSQVV